MSQDDSTSESKIDWFSILNKHLKSLKNIEEVRWFSFVLGSEDWLLETKDKLDDESKSTSLIVEVSKHRIFSWDEG